MRSCPPHSRRTPGRWLPGLLLLLWPLTGALAAPRTAAQAETEIERMLEDARSFYDNLELDSAEDALDRAVRLAERFNVTNEVVAQVYVQRGILSHVRDKDSDAAVEDFAEALRIDPRAALDPLVSTPSLEQLFADARQKARRSPGRRPPDDQGGDPDPPPEDRRPPPPREPDVRHTPPRDAEAGRPLTIAIEVSEALNRDVYRVYLFYRSARVDSVQKLELAPTGRSNFSGRIPGRFVAGRTLTYYVVVEDRSGGVIGGVQSARDPVSLAVKGGALGDLDEIPSGAGLNDEGDDGSPSREYVSISLGLGTGGGFITDLARPQTQKGANIRPGFALAPLHSLIEADFWIIERLALSAFARVQIIEFAHMEGARLKFKALVGTHQLVLRAGGGFGQVRHLVDLGEVLDTTLEGPYFYTLGASYVYQFNPTVGLHITPDFIHLIGSSPSLHIDFTTGIRMSF